MNLAEQGLGPRSIAWTAVGMYAGGGLIGLVAAAIPGGPSFSVLPSCLALVVAGLLAVVGPRRSRLTLAPLGPAGTQLASVEPLGITGEHQTQALESIVSRPRVAEQLGPRLLLRTLEQTDDGLPDQLVGRHAEMVGKTVADPLDLVVHSADHQRETHDRRTRERTGARHRLLT